MLLGRNHLDDGWIAAVPSRLARQLLLRESAYFAEDGCVA